jgi:cystathionine beta-lyase/cystathionine gamma-synthase
MRDSIQSATRYLRGHCDVLVAIKDHLRDHWTEALHREIRAGPMVRHQNHALLERRAVAARAAELARVLEDVSAGYGDDRPAYAEGSA